MTNSASKLCVLNDIQELLKQIYIFKKNRLKYVTKNMLELCW